MKLMKLFGCAALACMMTGCISFSKERTEIIITEPSGEMIALATEENVTPVVIDAEENSVLLSLEGAKWIWHPVNPRAEGEVMFRASIDVSSAVEAQLIFACDNSVRCL